MSLSREMVKEACDYINENCSTLFGQKFWECRSINAVRCHIKSDKYETKFLVVAKFRVFLLSGKQAANLKTEKCFNILALRHLHVITPDHALNIGWEERGKMLNVLIKTEDEKESTSLACNILAAIKHYFPDIRLSLPKFVQLNPPTLLTFFPLLPSSTPDLPCNNFRRSYVAYCDYNDHSYKDEVVWDIERIYFVHDIHELRLEDFGHLSIKDQVGVLGSVQFSSYFTGIYVDGFKLSTEHVEAILDTVRRSHSLKSLHLVNCCLTKDFVIHFASALSSNQDIPLEYLNLSGNSIDDKKGISHLAIVLPRIRSLKFLSFNDCALSEKSVHHLAYGLYAGFGLDSSTSRKFELHSLVLSRNVLKDDTNELVNFVSLCNTLRTLDLSNTGFWVDKIWAALKLGGLLLENLRLAGCHASKKIKDNTLMTVKELFSSMINLKELDLAGTSVGSGILQSILTGISNNSRICDISLNLDGVFDGQSYVSILEQHIANCPIVWLSLRDNNLEADTLNIVSPLIQMRNLKHLDFGGANFHGLKSNKKYGNTLSKVLTELIKLASCKDSHLETLVLSDCRLGSFMSFVLNGLSVSSLKVLDISGNDIGNFGAKLLSKTLQLNDSLKKVVIDRNQIGVEGYSEILHALKYNCCLTSISYPVVDVAESFNRPDRSRLLHVLTEIEKCLERNRSTSTNLSQQCCQKTVHTLINHCDSYDVNHSNEKKVIFYNLTKSILDLGYNNDAKPPILLNSIAEKTVDDAMKLIEDVEEKVSDEFVDNFMGLLASRNIDISNEAVMETMNGNVDKCNGFDVKLSAKNELYSIVKAHLIKKAWSSVLSRAESLLRSMGALKVRTLSNCHIDNSLHAVITEKLNLLQRPNSTLLDSLVLSHTSGDNSMEGVLLDDSNVKSVPLVHLAKNRPRPARQLKNKKTNGFVNEVLEAAVGRKSRQASGASSHRQSHDGVETQPHSPSLTASTNADSTTEPSPTPPPLVPRRQKASVPPKLPPKPLDTTSKFSSESPRLSGQKAGSNRATPTKMMASNSNDGCESDLE